MSGHDILIGIALEEQCLTLEQLAAACAVEPVWVLHLVEEGLFPAMPGPREQWRFDIAALRRARRIRQVERGFEAAPELAALVADMLEEMDELRARLARGAGR
jgi:chaperone modulatory protein CbpM